MSTTAQHTSHCPECPDPIEPGQRIRPTDHGWAHEGCTHLGRENVTYPVCVDCFLIHPPGVCDL